MLQKTIKEFIRPGRLPQVGPDDSVATAIEVMRSQHAYCVAVIDAGRLVGVFTERDFLNRVTAERRPIAGTAMREVMTPDPVTLGVDDCISYAINKMAVGGFRNVPIVDADGVTVALLDTRDVVAHLSDLFDALDEQGSERVEDREWTDIGGGA
ncbi:MAG TPA: CBS domain-containing protein [Kofleriaceae bacterium]|jgi:CBS domain-containing protein|nr:CBS domain-containing protein [Kofleriaceae bacterium]